MPIQAFRPERFRTYGMLMQFGRNLINDYNALTIRTNFCEEVGEE